MIGRLYLGVFAMAFSANYCQVWYLHIWLNIGDTKYLELIFIWLQLYVKAKQLETLS